MELQHRQFALAEAAEEQAPAVSIVMPCLNEVQSLPHCIGNALEALARLRIERGLGGEIVIADNGSTDGSQALAWELGARVVAVPRRGYGAALIGGCEAALGGFIVMGDCDGSYDFTEAVAMVARLEDGYELCLGSRFKGGIAPGAMPWKNRYIGNPALTGILNLFFRSGISDAHCGLRAIRKDAFERLRLTGSGMEFASEMVIKGALLKLRTTEVPATLSPDLRERAPHLRPWRDGWRHLRYLFMLSPTWVFGVPGLLTAIIGTLLLIGAAAQTLRPGAMPYIGDYWTILGSASFAIGHQCLVMMLAGLVYGIRSGYRRQSMFTRLCCRVVNLESMLIAGATLVLAGILLLGLVWAEWMGREFAPADNILLPSFATLLVVVGLQNLLGGFLTAIIGGNDSNFLACLEDPGCD